MIEELRKEIDQADEKILEGLEKRMKAAAKIGKFKIDNGLPTISEAREHHILQKAELFEKEKGLPKGAAVQIYKEIIRQSRRLEDDLRANSRKQ